MLKQTIFCIALIFITTSLSGETSKRKLALKDTIRDLSIEVPKDIERNLDELLVDWKSSFKPSAKCHQTNDNDIFYPDSVYIKRLYSMPSQMELAYNQIVRSYIDMYSSRKRSSVEYMLAKGMYYYPIIEETLDKYDLPLELKYLPVIESALNPVAVSRMGATGLWQFMLATGRMYDLEVNSLVDERRDPIKSTEAAARYLKDLYNIYEDWNLVIAAYNCGPGNVNKAIRRSGGQKDYWAIYPHLPKETRGYVPAFIAATYIMNYYPKHNICPMEYVYPLSVDTIDINQTVHFQQISEILDIPIEKIRNLNPQYKEDIIPGDFKRYTLCLPSRSIADFVTNEDTIFAHRSQDFLTHRKVVEVEGASSYSTKVTATHKVKRGETIGAISRKHGVSVAQIKKLNNLKSNRITVGKNLVIRTAPVTKTAPSIAQNQTSQETKVPQTLNTSNTSANENDASDNYFSNYYKSHGINSQAELVNNGTKSIGDSTHIIVADLSDQIQKTEKERNTFEDTKTVFHKIKIGETIEQIAKKYNVSSKDILAWNKLSSKKIVIGQRLKIQIPEKEMVVAVTADKAQVEQPPTETPVKEKPKAATKPKRTVYKVKKGDSLSIIASRYKGVTSKDIKIANNLQNDKLSIGQQLKIPVN